MFRKFFQLPASCKKTLFLVNQSVFSEPCHRVISKRGAGHSKWQNIKFTKETTDRSRAVNFHRISKQIQLAVKSGGDDPSVNSKLKSLIEEAQKSNMPKSTIQKAISSGKSQQLLQPYWVVFKGPKGVALGFEVTFANRNASFIKSKISPQAKKLNLRMEVHYHDTCTERGVIISKIPTDGSYDKAVEDAIVAGAEDVMETEDKALIFECSPERLEGVISHLTKLGYEIESGTTELDFKEHVALTDEEIKDIETIIAKLQDQNEEIIRVTYNVSG